MRDANVWRSGERRMRIKIERPSVRELSACNSIFIGVWGEKNIFKVFKINGGDAVGNEEKCIVKMRRIPILLPPRGSFVIVIF